MTSEPKLECRPALHYVSIACHVTEQRVPASCPDAIGFGRAAREATFEVVRALRVGLCRRRAGGATAGC
jgi:hypothetical protein